MNNFLEEVWGFHTNTLIFLGPKEDKTSKVLGHTCSIASHANGWSNSFVPLLLCKLGSDPSVRQDRRNRCVEGIQTGGFVTLSVVHLGGIFLTDKGDVVQCIIRDVGEVDA